MVCIAIGGAEFQNRSDAKAELHTVQSFMNHPVSNAYFTVDMAEEAKHVRVLGEVYSCDISEPGTLTMLSYDAKEHSAVFRYTASQGPKTRLCGNSFLFVTERNDWASTNWLIQQLDQLWQYQVRLAKESQAARALVK